jgi:hypothetical protein
MEVMNKGLKIVKLCLEMAINAHAMAIGMLKASLQDTEKATTARYSKNHAPQFTQEFLPQLDRDTLGTTKLGKEDAKTLKAVRGQFLVDRSDL